MTSTGTIPISQEGWHNFLSLPHFHFTISPHFLKNVGISNILLKDKSYRSRFILIFCKQSFPPALFAVLLDYAISSLQVSQSASAPLEKFQSYTGSEFYFIRMKCWLKSLLHNKKQNKTKKNKTTKNPNTQSHKNKPQCLSIYSHSPVISYFKAVSFT